MICALPVTVEPFQFSPAEPVAYELSHYHEIIRLFFYYLFRKYARKQVDRLLETR